MKQEREGKSRGRHEEKGREKPEILCRGLYRGDENLEELQNQFHRMVRELSFVSADEIPRIDLYMDQVLTFMEEHLGKSARDPENDKILTKTMINNYVKNDVLIPPVRKKYGMDHMILLLMIYYLKSYLSIGDIRQVLEPLKERYAGSASEDAGKETETCGGDGTDGNPGKEPSMRSLEEIYRAVYEGMSDELEAVQEDADRQFRRVRETFPDSGTEDETRLQKFALIARMSTEIYLKKLFIERLLDEKED